jgi:hypothetical protein
MAAVAALKGRPISTAQAMKASLNAAGISLEGFRFFDEKIGDVIFDAVLESAGMTYKLVRFILIFQLALAFRANQNLQQLFGKHFPLSSLVTGARCY